MRGGIALLLGIYLGFKELWRGRGKFLLFSLVISLITFLVLFVTALGAGLAVSNKEYIEKLNAQLLVYRKNSDLNIQASRLDQSDLRSIKRVEGVTDAGLLGLSSVSIRDPHLKDPVDVAMLGVEPGRPGEPPVVRGRGLERRRAEEAIIDINVARLAHLDLGDSFTVRSVQGAEEKFYSLLVVGVSDSRKITFSPAIFVPILAWEKVKPQAVPGQDETSVVANVIAVQLDNPDAADQMIPIIEAQVADVEVTDLVTAYKATPGYQAQQSTLGTQRSFLLLIGVLIIGGFFQIQTLQKVAQIGMLKAIGSSNLTVATAVLMQIVVVTVVGTLIGGAASLGLSLSFPPTVPIVFEPGVVLSAIVYLLIIGPLGGLVSIRYALKVEPLTALGLSG
jgi:putative ABC transport system permease protein